MAGLTTLYMQLLIIQGKTKQMILINFIKIIASISTCVILIPVFQSDALGWSYFAGYIISFAISLFVITIDKKREQSLYKDFLLIILSGVTIFFTRFIEFGNIWYEILFKICLFVLFIIIIMVIYKISVAEVMIRMKKIKGE